MEKMKSFLSIFLMVFVFVVSSNVASAQSLQTISNGESSKAVTIAKQSLTAEMATLKEMAQTTTAGSVANVDAVRRLRVFNVAHVSLVKGESLTQAYAAGKKELYQKIEAKDSDLPKLKLIEQKLRTFLN